MLLKRRLPKVKEFGKPLNPALLKDPAFFRLFVAAVLYGSSAFVPVVHFAAYTKDLGFSADKAALSVSLIGAGSAIGRTVIGAVADRCGVLRTFKASLLGTAAIVSLWAACTSLWAIYVFAFAYGFLAFAWYSLLPGTVALYYEPRTMGAVIGNIFVAFVPAAFSPMLAGYFYDRMGSYLAAQIYVPVFLFLCTGMVACLPDPATRTATSTSR